MADDGESRETQVSGCRFLDLPKFTDERGSLSFAEPHEHVPIDLERVYYLYDVPPDKTRGDHAHERLKQVMIAVHGSAEVLIDDGRREEVHVLDDPSEGLYIGPMVWRSLRNFSSGGVVLNLASRPYEEDDYIHDYETFKREAGSE